jgi:hypothetical protein
MSPNSFTIIAASLSVFSIRQELRNVVLPAPKKPVIITIGIISGKESDIIVRT